jgi:hypothetical protein
MTTTKTMTAKTISMTRKRREPAESVAIGEQQLTREEFCRMLRASGFIAIVAFWRPLERLAPHEFAERAKATLSAIASFTYEECGGVAFSPEEAESFEYCGLKPRGVRGPLQDL